MGVSMFGTGKKTIWDLGFSGSSGKKFLSPFESKYKYCLFLYRFFSFYQKVPSGLDHACFFSKYFTTLHPLQPKFNFY